MLGRRDHDQGMDWRENELNRYPDEGMAGGVCLGMARYLDIDVAILRAVFIGLLVFSGVGLVLYLALWVLVPEEPISAPPCAVDGIGEDEMNLAIQDLSQNPFMVDDS